MQPNRVVRRGLVMFKQMDAENAVSWQADAACLCKQREKTSTATVQPAQWLREHVKPKRSFWQQCSVSLRKIRVYHLLAALVASFVVLLVCINVMPAVSSGLSILLCSFNSYDVREFWTTAPYWLQVGGAVLAVASASYALSSWYLAKALAPPGFKLLIVTFKSAASMLGVYIGHLVGKVWDGLGIIQQKAMAVLRVPLQMLQLGGAAVYDGYCAVVDGCCDFINRDPSNRIEAIAILAALLVAVEMAVFCS